MDKAAATGLAKLMDEYSSGKVETKITSIEDGPASGQVRLGITTDEATQHAVANFVNQVFPKSTVADQAKAKVKAEANANLSATIARTVSLKRVSIKVPHMLCGGCASAISANLRRIGCEEIETNLKDHTCDFYAPEDMAVEKKLNEMVKSSSHLKEWEMNP